MTYNVFPIFLEMETIFSNKKQAYSFWRGEVIWSKDAVYDQIWTRQAKTKES